ncbi:hypothetical protein ACHAPJ_001535 [Fusarium lateritium]
MDYISSILTSRFEVWQSKRKNDQGHVGQGTPDQSPPSTPVRTVSSTLKPRRASDRYNDAVSYEEDDEVVEGSPEEWKQANLQRPKINRVAGQEILVTPTRPGASRYLTPSLSSRDDTWIMSPASVASPDPSEVFTPSSTISTPYSPDDTPEVEPRRSVCRNASYGKRHEESPTRRTDSTDESVELRDMMQKMKINEDDIDDEGGTDEPAHGPLNRSPSRLSMQFFPRKEVELSPVRPIVDFMTRSLKKKSLASGYVYCFAERSAPGYLKIGSIASPELGAKMEPPNSALAKKRNKDRVSERMRELSRKCEHDIVFKFEVFMPHAVQRMESLIHQTLREENRKAHCPARSCGTDHREWFKISESEALGVVEIWQEFSKLKPYNDMGQLREVWEKHASRQLRLNGGSTARRWLTSTWAKIVTSEDERNVQMEKLRDNLAQAAERRKIAEWQQSLYKEKAMDAQEDEEHIRRQLEKLQINNE